MKLIDLLPPQQRRKLRRLRKRIAKRQYMRRVREQRKLLCVGVDLPIDAGTCGRFVHDGYQRCIHCTRRRWWLLTRAFNPAEVSVAAMLEEHAADNDALYGVPRWLLTRAFSAAEVSSSATLEDRAAESDALYGVPQAVPLLEDVADPCLRWRGSDHAPRGSHHGNHLPSRPWPETRTREAPVAPDHVPAIPVDAPNVDGGARLAMSHHIDSRPAPPSADASFGLVEITPPPYDPKAPHRNLEPRRGQHAVLRATPPDEHAADLLPESPQDRHGSRPAPPWQRPHTPGGGSRPRLRPGARRPGLSVTNIPGSYTAPGVVYDPDRNTPKIETRRISDLETLGSHER